MIRPSAIVLSVVAIAGALLGMFGLTIVNGPNMVGSPVVIVVRILTSILFAGSVCGIVGGDILVLRSIANGFRLLAIAGGMLALGMVVLAIFAAIDSGANGARYPWTLWVVFVIATIVGVATVLLAMNLARRRT